MAELYFGKLKYSFIYLSDDIDEAIVMKVKEITFNDMPMVLNCLYGELQELRKEIKLLTKDDNDSFISPDEASKLLGVCKATFYKILKDNPSIESKKFGRRRLVKKSTLLKLV